MACALLLALPASSLAVPSADKPTLSFGGQRVGTTSAAQTVTVSVGAGIPSRIDGYVVEGPAAGDYEVTPPSAAVNFAATGGSQAYMVTFRPAATGARTASLKFTTQETLTAGTVTVALSGTGTTPAVTLDPASPSFAFGNQENGTTSGPQSFKLTNSGNAPLTVSSIALGGANAADFVIGYCVATPFTLQPGQSCSIGALFKPAEAGQKVAQIVVTDDATGSPRTIPLSGAGFVPDPGPPVAVTAPTANQKLRRTKKVRKRGKLVRREVPLTFRGSASDPGGLARVELALVNVKPSGGKCTFFDGKRKTQTGSCAAPTFFKATIDDKTWSYVLPAKATITTSEYVLVARAVNTKGVTTRKPASVRFRIAS